MCVACRTIHHDNTSELKDIDYLEKHYDAEKAIEYYTKPWFLFRTVNQICRTENIKDIYKFRIYISDLHQKLNQLSMEQERNNIKSSLEKVYHGKPLSGSVLQQLIDNKDHLISMNGFLSTTSDSKICNIYAGVEELIDEGYKGVLFVFEIDKVIKQPYADISKFSTIPDEAEILFSLGTIWRIKSIRHDEGSCTIELTSCNEFDSDLTQLREKYTGDNVSLLSLGDVLLELGDEDTAEWAYRKMLSQHINDNETCGILYYKIGMIKFDKKLDDEALANLIQAESLLRSSEKKINEITSSRPFYLHCSRPSFLKIYSNIGFMLEKNDKFDEATSRYEQALKEEGSDSELATVHHNLGLLYFRRGKYTKAKEHQEAATSLIDDCHLWSREFKNNLKRTNDQLDSIAKNEEQSLKKQKTTTNVLSFDGSSI
ncbi:unnamed protein product [Rotaria sp. Silwood1]|nr:unnamed protein product [Rotaria sp. Silwood1]